MVKASNWIIVGNSHSPATEPSVRLQLPDARKLLQVTASGHKFPAPAVSPPSVDGSIRRGLPAILSRTFDRLDTEAAWFRGYMAKVEAAGADAAMFRDRTTVMKYVFVAPTKAEAQEISRQPWEWDFQTLQKLTTPAPGAMPKAHEMYLDRAASGWPDGYDYADWAENVFIYDDPQGCAEKIAVLRDAGVQNLILWMGIGGVRNDLIKRSMRLFAEEVMPRFA